MDGNSSDSDSSVAADIAESAEIAMQSLLPSKSKATYQQSYLKFDEWCRQRKVKELSENILLAYFEQKGQMMKCSTLWSLYSMLRTMIYMKTNIDIRKYTNLIAFLKRKSEGYRPKKSRVFTKQNVDTFLKTADDDTYLMMKVLLTIGLAGACRREELTFLLTEYIKDEEDHIKITIPNTKTKIQREFTLTAGNIEGLNLVEMFRKYADLRSPKTNHQRFFVNYRNGKCTSQAVGINTVGSIPSKIALFLGLENPAQFTGHAFRRSSASLLANAGGDLMTLKQHGGWRSSSVAEGYVEASSERKRSVARKILGEEHTGVVREIACGSSKDEVSANTAINNAEDITNKGLHGSCKKVTEKTSTNLQAAQASGFYLNNCCNVIVNVYNK